jgi:hypothetical protein
MKKIYLTILFTMISFTNAMNNELPLLNLSENSQASAPLSKKASAEFQFVEKNYPHLIHNNTLSDAECKEIVLKHQALEKLQDFFEEELYEINISTGLQEFIDDLNC